jgi:hypothetical protein
VKKFRKFLLEIILAFPSGLILGMVTPLHLVHFDLASTGETDIFFKDTYWSLPIGEVVVEVSSVVVNLLEGLGLVRNLQAFAELRDMKDVMELTQLRGQLQLVGHLSTAL